MLSKISLITTWVSTSVHSIPWIRLRQSRSSQVRVLVINNNNNNPNTYGTIAQDPPEIANSASQEGQPKAFQQRKLGELSTLLAKS